MQIKNTRCATVNKASQLREPLQLIYMNLESLKQKGERLNIQIDKI